MWVDVLLCYESYLYSFYYQIQLQFKMAYFTIWRNFKNCWMHLCPKCKIKIQELSRPILNFWTQILIIICIFALLSQSHRICYIFQNRLFLNNTWSALHHLTFKKYVLLPWNTIPKPSTALYRFCTLLTCFDLHISVLLHIAASKQHNQQSQRNCPNYLISHLS